MPKVIYVQNDLPENFQLKSQKIAIDCEMTGLDIKKDKLCVLQLWDSIGDIFVIQFSQNADSPRLKKLLADEKISKIFHFGRKDLSFISRFLCHVGGELFDTKIAYRILSPADEMKASLKELTEKFANVKLEKSQQMSDWTKNPLSEKQVEYASEDVLYLHKISEKLTELLKKKGSLEIANSAFTFLKHLVIIDQEIGDEYHRIFKYN